MSDLLRRIKRPRRTPAADPARGTSASETAAGPLEASPGTGGAHLAGEDAADQRPTTLRRGRLRKRLRFLERELEILLRDLGGLVYEIHRSGTTADRERHRALVAGKVARLGGLDSELDAGLAALGQARGDAVLREPGIGGLCPRCGEIHGSDARFCSACGFPLEVAPAAASAAPVAPAPGAVDAIVPAAHAPGVATPPSGTRTEPTRAPAAEQPTRISAPVAVRAPADGEAADPPPSEPEPR